jgi:hypothetical protein
MKRKRKSAPALTVRQIGREDWAVVTALGQRLFFRTQREAWLWIDNNTSEGRGHQDKANRIRDAFSRR